LKMTRELELLKAICTEKRLKVVNFLLRDKRDWCKTDIARKSGVSRMVVSLMIRMKILENTRGQMYQLNSLFTKRFVRG